MAAEDIDVCHPPARNMIWRYAIHVNFPIQGTSAYRRTALLYKYTCDVSELQGLESWLSLSDT